MKLLKLHGKHLKMAKYILEKLEPLNFVYFMQRFSAFVVF